MEDFLSSVYAKSPETDVINGAATAFAAVKWHDKEALVGAVDSDIESLCDSSTPIPVKVLMRAAARLANASSNARLAAGGPSASSGQSSVPALQAGVSAAQVQEIVGADLSAATVAKLISAGNDEVDVAMQLRNAKMTKLPYHMQCDRLVWKILEAENKAAATTSRTAYAYVDLTAKEVLPIWLPQDAIGGKSMFGSDWIQADSSASTLAELGQALQAATSQHKIFRSYPQWNAAFMKYAAAAIPMNQMTTARLVAYVNVIAKIHEDEKCIQGSPLVAVLYDDVFRKTIARRAEAKDPELDLDDAFSTTDKHILEACKMRVDTVARATPGVSGSAISSQGNELDRQTAAAEIAAKKAEAAVRALNQASQRFENREDDDAISRKDQKRGVWHLDKIAQSRQKRSNNWQDNRSHGKGGHGKGGSKGGKKGFKH